MRTLILLCALIFATVSASTVEAGILGKIAKGYVASKVAKKIYLSAKKYPQSAKHIADAQKAGAPKTLTVDRVGAAERRKAALKGKKTEPGMDRDEYPPAMSREGGQGASVRSINKGDNRGAGACLGAQCRDVPNGGRVKVLIKKE